MLQYSPLVCGLSVPLCGSTSHAGPVRAGFLLHYGGASWGPGRLIHTAVVRSVGDLYGANRSTKQLLGICLACGVLHRVTLVLQAGGGHHTVGGEDLSLTILAALFSHTLQYPKHFELGAITVITRPRGAVELEAATTRDVVFTLLITRIWEMK